MWDSVLDFLNLFVLGFKIVLPIAIIVGIGQFFFKAFSMKSIFDIIPLFLELIITIIEKFLNFYFVGMMIIMGVNAFNEIVDYDDYRNFNGNPDWEDNPSQVNESDNPGLHWVDSYERQDGTNVDGYYRSNPDGDLSNNLDSSGN